MTPRNGFVTDLDVTRAAAAACGRARWKAENEIFGVLKTHGHNFDHGREILASMPGGPPSAGPSPYTPPATSLKPHGAARRETGTRMRLFEHLRAIAAYHVFPSWQALMTALITGLPQPAKA